VSNNQYKTRTAVVESVSAYTVGDLTNEFTKQYPLLSWAIDKGHLFNSDEILIIRVVDFPNALVCITPSDYFITRPKKGSKITLTYSRKYGWSLTPLSRMEVSE